MMSIEGSTKVVNFMTPGAGVLVLGHDHINAFFLSKSSLLWGIDKTNEVYGNIDQGWVYQNCKWLDPRGRGSCAGAWPYKSHGECSLHPNLSYTAHWLLLVLRDYNATFLCHFWFFFLWRVPVDMQIWALLTRSQCRVSDTQVTNCYEISFTPCFNPCNIPVQ